MASPHTCDFVSKFLKVCSLLFWDCFGYCSIPNTGLKLSPQDDRSPPRCIGDGLGSCDQSSTNLANRKLWEKCFSGSQDLLDDCALALFASRDPFCPHQREFCLGTFIVLQLPYGLGVLSIFLSACLEEIRWGQWTRAWPSCSFPEAGEHALGGSLQHIFLGAELLVLHLSLIP